MFNFIKKKEGFDSNTEGQSCCSESITTEEKKEVPCCGCSCGQNTPANEKSNCCRE